MKVEAEKFEYIRRNPVRAGLIHPGVHLLENISTAKPQFAIVYWQGHRLLSVR
jgi:hypothetical protein